MSDHVFVSIYLGSFGNEKLDRKTTHTTNKMHGAKEDAGKYKRQKLSDEFLAEIKSIDGEIRKALYLNTASTGVTGVKLLVEKRRPYFEAQIMPLFERRDFAIDTLRANLLDEIEHRKQNMADLFNPADYPDPDELCARYRHRLMYLNVPSGKHVSDSALKAQLEQARQDAFHEAYREIWQRLLDAAQDTVDRLSNYNPDKPRSAPAWDKLVGNLQSLLEALEHMNIWDDPDFSHSINKLKRHVASVAPDALKEDERARAQAISAAQSVINARFGKDTTPPSGPPEPADAVPIPFTVGAVPTVEAVPATPAETVESFDDLLD